MKSWRALLPVALSVVLLGGLLGLACPAAAEEGVVHHATLTVQPDRVGAARHRLDTVVEQLGGEITTERAVLGPAGRLQQARVVIRVPERRLDTAVDQLGKLGTLLDQSHSAEDVAMRIADIEAVVAAQRSAVARVEALVAGVRDRAELAAVRPELRARRAELARQERALAALLLRVARPAITLRLVTGPPDPDPPTQQDQPGTVVALGDDLWWRLGLALLLGLAG